MNKTSSSSITRVTSCEYDSYPATAINRGSILLPLLVVGGFSAITIGMTKTFLPLKATALNANEFQMGLVAAALPLGMLLMSLPTGWLLNRFSGTFIYCLGAIAAALIYPLFAYLNELVIFLFVAVCLASCFPLRFVSVQKAFFVFMQKESLASAGWLRATQMAGAFVIGPMLASLFLNVGQLSQLPLLISTILILSIIIALVSKVVTVPDSAFSVQTNDQQARDSKHRSLKPSLGFVYAIEGSIFACMQIFNTFSVMLVVQQFNYDKSYSASLIAWHGFGFALCLLMGGYVLKQFSRVSVQLISLLVTALVFIIYPITNAYWQVVMLALISGLFLGALTLQNMQIFSEASKDAEIANKIASMSILIGPLGGVSGSLLAGVIAHILGLDFAYYFAASILFITGTLLFLSYRNQMKYQELS